VLPQVYEKFVRTGKVELIYLDLPLRMHPHAFKAAEAAACAGDQQMFWDMHHLLFANQQALAPDQLPRYAEELGLDVAAFQKCLSSGRHAAGIREDMRAAQILGITSTPTYLLGRRLPGSDKVEILEIVKGVPPYEVLEEKLNALLAPASK
jgi:protein-disulfide isomerase